MAYSHTTLAQIRTQLSERLHDPNSVFWLTAELNALLREALRTWQCFTSYWRERATFATASGTAFYDIPTACPTLRGYTLTDRDLINDIQYHLMEPANDWGSSTSWAGTEQFTMSDLTYALQRRRNQFLAETGCTVTRSTMHAPAAPISRVSLSDNIIDVRRVAWYDATPTYTILWRSDEHALQAYAVNWTADITVPHSYSASATPPVSLQIAPPPLDAGFLELLSVEAEADLDPASSVLMSIPDDFCWIVKWGAMADLLGKDGPASDPARAAYCEKLYRLGVDVARQQPCIVQGEVNGIPLMIDALHSLDSYNTGWQNTSGVPTILGSTGLNLIAASPVPDGVYSVTVDVVRDAPIPADDLAFVQLGREELEAVLGYAEHLAMFKVGGPEWEASSRYWDNFIQMGSVYSESLLAICRNTTAMADQSRKEELFRPRRKK